MKSFHKLNNRLAALLLSHRWLIVVVLTVSVFLFEAIEHRGESNPVDAHFVREILVFGVIYPVAIGLMLNMLLKGQERQNAILRQQNWEKQFQQQVRYATHWDERLRIIVYFPPLIAPVAGVILLKHDPKEQEWRQVAESWFGGQGKEVFRETAVSPTLCGLEEHLPPQGIHPMTAPHLAPGLHGYCLPLSVNNRLTGLLHLYLPTAEQLDDEQAGIFNYLATSMALALDTAVLENPEFLQAEAARQERERIAHQLHSSLGQHLSYLRLKLDQLTMEEMLQSDPTILQDLERMRDVANEAYEQSRYAMVTVQPDGSRDLVTEMLKQAQLSARQASFQFHYHILGNTVPLHPLARHKILFIFREAFTNIQRHAHATHVHLTITWTANDLTISLADDGLGFDPKPAGYGPFGLLIMQQRAEEIEAHLTIQSVPGQGTLVTLQCPLLSAIDRNNNPTER